MEKRLWSELDAICLLIASVSLVSCQKSTASVIEPSVPPTPHVQYREAVLPVGSVNAFISRLDSTSGLLADMNDRGDFLFQTTKRSSPIRHYVQVYQGRVVEERKIEQQITLRLCPNGTLMPVRHEADIDRISPIEFPFECELDRPKTYPDASVLVVRRRHDEQTKKDPYVIDLDTQRDIRANVINGEGTAMPIKSVKNVSSFSKIPMKKLAQLNGQPIGTLEVGENIEQNSSAISLTTSKEVYRSESPMAILDKSDSDTIWIKDRIGNRATGADALIAITKNERKTLKLPEGYSDVMRLANTGRHIVGTFGHIEDAQPIRSFLRDGDNWKELPIPAGYDFSFVQRIFNDGTILGFIASADDLKIRQVVWHGDACTVLDDLDHWPRQGLYSIVVLSNRRGDIYVRNVLNSKTNACEYYLLNVSVKP